jgi:hypothetical protein
VDQIESLGDLHYKSPLEEKGRIPKRERTNPCREGAAKPEWITRRTGIYHQSTAREEGGREVKREWSVYQNEGMETLIL